MKNHKVFIETLGCPKNAVDSSNAADILRQSGAQIVNEPEAADVIMVNTCAFINDAKEESIDTIFEYAQYKNGNEKLLIVSGCLGERYNDEIFADIPEADIVIGVNDYDQLPKVIEAAVKDGRLKVKSKSPDAFLELGGNSHIDCGSAYLKIAEGCDNCCTYCVIPSIRGSYRSRKKEEIIKEAKSLVLEGCKEIVLVAQDVTSYGIELYGKYALPELLRELGEINELKWIRLMYCYCDKITEQLIDEIATNPKVCKYLDIPLQHCSDAILKGMNRKSTKDSILRTIEMLRKRIKDIHIRTTIITGFPGERVAEFEELCQFIQDVKFERLGVFAYSPEEGTPAATMKGKVREDVKQRRKEMLMQLQLPISLKHNLKKIGQTLEVLVEEKLEDENMYMGRTSYDAKEIDNAVIFTCSKALLPGSFTFVKITDAFDYDLVGEDVSHEFTE